MARQTLSSFHFAPQLFCFFFVVSSPSRFSQTVPSLSLMLLSFSRPRLRAAEPLCALADAALRRLADWVEWEPSREASEECSRSRSVNRWRSLLWNAAHFPVLHTRTHTQHSSIHPLSVIVLAFFLSYIFYSVPTFPKAVFCAVVGPQAPSRPPSPSAVGLLLGALWDVVWGRKMGLDWIHVVAKPHSKHWLYSYLA